MGLAFILTELGCGVAVLFNVIEGGKRSKSKDHPRKVEAGSVLRAVPEAALLLDKQGHILDLNPAAERLISHPRAELLGSAADRVLGQSIGDSQRGVQGPLSRALEGQSTQCSGQVFRAAGGDSLPVTLAVSPVYDRSGQVAGSLLAIQDRTEVARLQSELESSERHLAVGEMTAGLVHDFSNVLNAISEAVHVLETDGQGSERDRTLLGVIHNAVRRGGETVNNVRKYLVGKRVPPSQINLCQLLDEVLELTNPALRTHAGILVVRETQDCDEVQANADELRRALTNLVLNALDAMPERGTLTVGCRQKGGRVVVSIKDTGTGISAEAQSKIFSAYFTTKSKGMGLGLAGARRAIEAQGGNICFESLPGRGTTFYVTLPTRAEVAQHNRNGSSVERKIS